MEVGTVGDSIQYARARDGMHRTKKCVRRRGAEMKIDLRKLTAAACLASFASGALLSQSLAQSDDGWVNGRTPDGQPDLQGVWTNDTITPIERPTSLADRDFLTPEEIEAMEIGIAERSRPTTISSSAPAAMSAVTTRSGSIRATPCFPPARLR